MIKRVSDRIKEQDEWNTLTEEELKILKEGTPEEIPRGLCPTKEELLKAEKEVEELKEAWNGNPWGSHIEAAKGLSEELRFVVNTIGKDLNEAQIERLKELITFNPQKNNGKKQWQNLKE